MSEKKKDDDDVRPVDFRTVSRDGTFDHEAYRTWETEAHKRHLTVDGKLYLRGSCGSLSAEAVRRFPELRLVRGRCGWSEHWWCLAPDGTIIDPTVKQFRAGITAGDYRFLDESTADRLSTGMCGNCGGPLYYNANACDAACLRGIAAEMGIPMVDGSSYRYNPDPWPEDENGEALEEKYIQNTLFRLP